MSPRKPAKKKVKDTGKVRLMVGTKKGAFFYTSDVTRKTWKLSKPHFLGSVVHHVVADPRERGVILLAARTGHLGPTVFRSTDNGKSWTEAKRPPAFAPAKKGKKGRTVNYTFWLTPSLASEPGVWYAGTSPQGLFRSTDGGVTWDEVEGFNHGKKLKAWTGNFSDGTPDGSVLHSILVHPSDPNHLYLGMSSGGTFESTDRGDSWVPLNKGVAMDFAPPGDYEFGHDPHHTIFHPADPERLYQQNHCGIYRLDRPGTEWDRIGDNMPTAVGDVGFPVVGHPRDPNTVWVIPMDGSDVWPRISPNGKPSVYQSKDGGKSWKAQAKGLPKVGWHTVLRQSFCGDAFGRVGLYFGTTSGEVWASTTGGGSWKQIGAHLPRIQSVTLGRA